MRKILWLTVMMLAGSNAQAEECGLHLVTSVTMDMTGGMPLLPIGINNTPRRFLFDTAGVVTQISQPVVDELKLRTTGSPLKLLDVNGNASTEMATIDDFALGPLKAEDLHVQVATISADGGADGLLTPSLFARLDIDIDFGPGRFAYFLQDHCPGKVVYWKADAVAVVPVTMRNLHIMVPVTVDGHVMNAVIDTGASKTTMDMDTARRIFGVTPEGKPVAGHANDDPDLPLYDHVFTSLSFEGVTVSNAHVALMADHVGKKDSDNGYLTGTRVKRVMTCWIERAWSWA